MDISRELLERKEFFDTGLANIYSPAYKPEDFMIIYLNIILVVNRVRTAFLPVNYMRKTCELFAEQLPAYVKMLSLNKLNETGTRDLHLIVRADYAGPEPETDIELGSILGYPCASDWPDIMSAAHTGLPTVGYQIVATLLENPTSSIQLFAYNCIATRHFTTGNMYSDVVKALIRDPFAKKYVKELYLGIRGIPVGSDWVFSTPVYINPKYPPQSAQGGGALRKRHRRTVHRRKGKATRRRRS